MGFFEDVRSLNQGEKDLANTVFKNTISFDNVYLGNRLGLGGVEWAEYQYIDEIIGDRFILHMGVNAYSNATSSGNISSSRAKKIRNAFIHELVHVWQGQHSHLSGGYQASSLLSQAWAIVTGRGRNAAYRYTAGEEWGSYNVEQQASIVEDWFKNGSSESDALFRYIRDNIRK